MRVLNETVKLQNDGRLWIFFLGCGGAFSKRFFQNNILVVKGEDHLLVDCGTRGTQALTQAGLTIADITNFLPTHSHADHIGGLEELSLINHYVFQRRPTMFITPEYQRILWSQSMRGGCEMNEAHHGKGLRFRDYWTAVRPKCREDLPRDTRTFWVGSLKITTFRTRHYPQQARSWEDAMYSIGLIIDDRVLFSGDTQFDPDLSIEFDKVFHFETIFHDAQFFTGGIHSSIQELSKLPLSIRRRMLLMHYGDNVEDQHAQVKTHRFRGFVDQQVIYEFD